jgi:Putative T7SS secretion signal domain
VTGVTPGADPAELIPGDPDAVEQVAARLTRVASSAGDAAGKLHTLDTDVWAGEAAELYRGAIGDVPARLARAAEAFGAAAEALRDYARALRDGRSTAVGAVRMVERSTPETAAADRQSADALLARATADVDAAGRLAAERLARAQADAPTLPPGGGTDLAVRVDTEHQLDDPDGFVSTPDGWGDSVADMRYTSTHDVPFAGALGGDAGQPTAGADGWQEWATSGSGRHIGVIEAGTVAAAGAAVAAVTVIGRRRDRTALSLVGLDEDELRRRRDELGGSRRQRDDELGPVRAARLGTAATWRTRLAPPAHPPGTVQHWTGSGGGRPAHGSVLADDSGSIDRDVRGAVLRIGRPAHEAS